MNGQEAEPRSDVDAFARHTAVIVVHYGDLTPTLVALRSVLELRPSPAKVVLQNNGPTRISLLEGFGSVEIFNAPNNRGYAGAINDAARAARKSGVRHLWILNNDVVVESHSLVSFAKVFLRDPDTDIAGSYVSKGGRIWFGGGSFSPMTGRATHDHFGGLPEHLGTGEVRDTQWINGCSMMISMSSFDTRGQFDENFFLYKEELDWQVRMPVANAKVIEEVLVEHTVGQATGGTDGRLGRVFMSRNGLLLARKQQLLFRRACWLGAWLVDYIGIPLARGRFSQVRDGLLGARLVASSPEEVMRVLA